jgi:hypothetical protein
VAKREELDKAVIVASSSRDINESSIALIVWYKGKEIEDHMDHTGPYAYDLEIYDSPEGISIWEGGFESDGDDWFSSYGSFRDPTQEEWEAIMNRRSPFEEMGGEVGTK